MSSIQPICPSSIAANFDPTKNFLRQMKEAKNQSDWVSLSELYRKSSREIDVNYAPTNGRCQGESILFLSVVNEQWDLFDMMCKNQPNADFTLFPKDGDYANESIPYILAATPYRPGLAHVIASRQDIDYTVGSNGFSIYWVAVCSGLWSAVELIHSNSTQFFIDQHPGDGLTPLFYAAMERQLSIVKKMLYLKPEANLDTFYNGESAIELIFQFNPDCKERDEVLDLLIFLGASAPTNHLAEYQEIQNKLKDIINESKSHNMDNHIATFISYYPHFKDFSLTTLRKGMVKYLQN